MKTSIIKVKSLSFLFLSYFIFNASNLFTSEILAQSQQSKSIKTEDASVKEFKHALNMCPVAVVFGIYAVNYEYKFTKHSGLVLRYEYEDIPKSYTDASIEADGMAFSINYRWHRTGKMKSEFAGLFTRYRIYEGQGTSESTDFDFTTKDVTVGANIGKRWVWDSGFNMTFAFGYGYMTDDREITPSNSEIKNAVDEFEKEYDFSKAFLGEFSIGYAF